MASEKKIYDKLTILEEGTVLNEAALADILGVHSRTVKRMELNGHIPRHFKLGIDNCWIAGELTAHFYKRANEAQKRNIAINESFERYAP